MLIKINFSPWYRLFKHLASKNDETDEEGNNFMNDIQAARIIILTKGNIFENYVIVFGFPLK